MDVLALDFLRSTSAPGSPGRSTVRRRAPPPPLALGRHRDPPDPAWGPAPARGRRWRCRAPAQRAARLHGRLDRPGPRPARVDRRSSPRRCRPSTPASLRAPCSPAPPAACCCGWCSACWARCASCAPRGGHDDLPPAVHRRGDDPGRPHGGCLGRVPVHHRAPRAGVPALVRHPRQPQRPRDRRRHGRPRRPRSSRGAHGGRWDTGPPPWSRRWPARLVLVAVATAMGVVTVLLREDISARAFLDDPGRPVRPDHRARGRAGPRPRARLHGAGLVVAAADRRVRAAGLGQPPDAGPGRAHRAADRGGLPPAPGHRPGPDAARR